MISDLEKKKLIEQTDKMLDGVFVFDGIWDMEKCDIPVENKDIRFDITYNSDNEWAYMFTRMDYLYKFIYATSFTNDDKYIKYGLKIIDSWYKVNKKYICGLIGKIFIKTIKINNLGFRSLDVSIMISNITDYIIYSLNNNYIDNSQYEYYKNIVIKVINYLLPLTKREFKLLSNWGIIENSNILYCIYKLNLNNNKLLEDLLLKQIDNQILDDGYHIESSPMYLVEVLLSLTRLYSIASKSLKNKLIKPINQGCTYIKNIRTNDNCIPNLGDSDIINISDLMIIVGSITNQKEYYKYSDKELDIEYCYKFNIKRVKLNKYQIKDEFIKYKYQSIYRDSSSYLMCSNTNKVIDGHKHCDYLNVLFNDLLIDLGRYSYKRDETREFLIGPKAHNTINFINKNYYEPITNFVTKHEIKCLENEYIDNKEFKITKMSCIFGEKIKVSRYTIYNPKIGLLITDIIGTNDKCEYELYFNLGNNIKINNNKIIELINDKDKYYYFNDRNLEIKINKVIYSPTYNVSNSTKQLLLKSDYKCITNCFMKNKCNIIIKYEDNMIKYKIDDKELEIRETL